jgi:hypothetical protein
VVRVVPNALRAVAVLGKLTQPALDLLGLFDPAESLVPTADSWGQSEEGVLPKTI